MESDRSRVWSHSSICITAVFSCRRVRCVFDISQNMLKIQGAAERTPLFGKLINSELKKIRQMFFLFLESTQNAVLRQRVLNKTSLKWWP